MHLSSLKTVLSFLAVVSLNVSCADDPMVSEREPWPFEDPGQIRPEDPSDMDILADDGADEDASSPVDMAPMVDAAPEPLTCPYDFGERDPQRCVPTTGIPDECEDGFECSLALDPAAGRIFPACVTDRNGTRGLYESCNSDCEDGLFCANWRGADGRGRVCSRICELDSGLGCGEDEVCVDLFDGLDFYGLCAPTCDNPGAECGNERRCLPNYRFYTTESCGRAFRCVATVASATEHLQGCRPDQPDLQACAAPFICYDTRVPRAAFGECHLVCETDSDCVGVGQQECGPAFGALNLRTCL